jgi:hypothetical protein
MNSAQVREALLDVEDIVKGPTFESWRKRFVRENLNVFTYEDENKLEYTAIHKKYEEGVEKIIAEGMREGFDMSAFMTALPEFLEGEGGREEDIGKAVTLLLEVGDFVQFRDMMLYLKKEEDQAEEKHSEDHLKGMSVKASSVPTTDVDGMMNMCANLSTAADTESGWENMLTLDWMKIDKKPVPKDIRKSPKEIYLRGIWYVRTMLHLY